MAASGEGRDGNTRPRQVTVIRPAQRWRLGEVSGILSPRMAFGDLERKRAQAEEDEAAEQAATLNLARYGLGLDKAGLLPPRWQDDVKDGNAPKELLLAAMAVTFAWRVAQSLFAGRRPAPRQLDRLQRACANRQRHRQLWQEQIEQLAQELPRLVRSGDKEWAALARELPTRHPPDAFAPWWRVAFWVRGVAQAPASVRQDLCERFRLCLECGCVIVLRKRAGQTRRFCDRTCRRRHARKKRAP